MSSRKNGVRKQDAAISAQAQQDLAQVYGSIMARNPEHDFDPTLDRVRDVCDLLGNPQQAYRSIHITGTNGKTSTARMIESLVGQYGLRTGRFTSPHLSSVTERIAIDGEPISAERFVEVYRDIEPYIDMVDAKSVEVGQPRLSFFEVLTVMAFAAFADAPVDVAIIEVGMGGSWDSTNVIDADISVITPISLDHQSWLGDTVRDIAIEKSGIIKQDKIAITSVQDDEALEALSDAAGEKQARLIVEGCDIEVASRLFAVGGQLIGLRTPAALYDEIYLPLFGEHQAQNALLALTAVEMLIAGGGALSAEIVEQGFAAVTSPGRLEIVRSSPTIIVDAAHNGAGAQALAKTIEDEFQFARLIGVVAILGDKDAETVLSFLEPILAEIVVTQSSSVRSTDVSELEELAIEIFGEDRVFAADELSDAIDIAATRAESEDEIGVGTGTGVLVAGSVILAAEARTLLGRG
ncbi:folylpolyglutamate synthase/dihydrofolate synthase family protein [Jonesiaceae bacterium BS-20]|uniref:Dihydrofolate synthase/folylpolyglutamate synthase n=1 Tax=Jonesiaceae bacterium BS-20 TaxID=3120821 RepID=A0AAU7DYT8_9MICO